MTSKQSGAPRGKSLCAKLSHKCMEESLNLLATKPDDDEDFEAVRLRVSQIRVANKSVSNEVKRVEVVAECRRLGMTTESATIA